MAEQLKDESPRSASSTQAVRPRAMLWRAIAGMALAVAIWAALVAIEFSTQVTHVSAVYRHHIERLERDIRRLHHDVAVSHHQLALERGRTANRDDLTRVLNAPDARIARLATPQKSTARGLVTMSRSLGSAILEVNGLPASPPGHVYVLWWMMRGRAHFKASEFVLHANNAVTIIAVTMPPREWRVRSCVITLEPTSGPRRPTGQVAMSGTVRG